MLRYKYRSGGRRHTNLSLPCTQPHSKNPRSSDRLAQWRREAPPRRLRSTLSPPSSGSAAGGPKAAVIYIATTSTPSPWTPPDLLPPLTVETLYSRSTCFYSLVIDLVYIYIYVSVHVTFVSRIPVVSIASRSCRSIRRTPLMIGEGGMPRGFVGWRWRRGWAAR